MFNYEILPHLDDLTINEKLSTNRSKDQAVQTVTLEDNKKQVLFLNLAPTVNNSTLVRQRATAKDSLAAATLSTAASLPLMIGGRSKCVVNLLDDQQRADPNDQDNNRERSESLPETHQAQIHNKTGHLASLSPQLAQTGPKNTALRAEQRRQNMVSVVRPVMNIMTNHPTSSLSASSTGSSSSSSTSFYSPATRAGSKLDKSSWDHNEDQHTVKSSVIDDFINLEQKVSLKPNITDGRERRHFAGRVANNLDLDELMLLGRLNLNQNQHQLNEHQIRQQMILMKREEHELNRGIRKQHRFVMLKIEERKRNLQIIQSVWYQRDLKHAIEKLVDLYNEGLIFTCQSSNIKDSTFDADRNQKQKDNVTLNSLNTSLVVDVIGVLILRPKLWNLEICQLILPIIVNDLLLQYDSQNIDTNKYEYYVEVALKSLKLILTHFSPIIKTTLESLKEAGKLTGKVDLSREDRVSKCLNCYKFLLEAQGYIMKRHPDAKHENNKLSFLYRDLSQSFANFQASFRDIQELSQRSRKNEQKS